MQIAKLFGRETVFRVHRAQNLARFNPVSLCRRENGVVLRKRRKEFALSSFGGSTPQFGQHDGGCADQAYYRFDPLLVASSAEVIDENRSVKYQDITHPSRYSPWAANRSFPACLRIRALNRRAASTS